MLNNIKCFAFTDDWYQYSSNLLVIDHYDYCQDRKAFTNSENISLIFIFK
jgi:hypothetical protein